MESTETTTKQHAIHNPTTTKSENLPISETSKFSQSVTTKEITATIQTTKTFEPISSIGS
jgi:hypothetical protein